VRKRSLFEGCCGQEMGCEKLPPFEAQVGDFSCQEEVTNLSFKRTFFPSFRKWVRGFHGLLKENACFLCVSDFV
jgi:hypothetical protein